MYKVRDANLLDSAQVVNVLRRSITAVCAPDYNDQSVIDEWLSNKTEHNIRKWIQSDKSYSVVCTDSENSVVGFALATLQGEILLMYLAPEALHRGNGKLMLEKLESTLSKTGLTAIKTTSTITARRFYERNGFVRNGEPQLVGNIKGDFPLIKSLTPNKSPNMDAKKRAPVSSGVKGIMRIIRPSRTGLILAALYIGIILTCVIWAQFITDPKGKYIILQLPVVLQHGLLLAIEATSLLKGMSWPSIYLLLGTPMLIVLVFLGNFFENYIKKDNLHVDT